ncbi:hypothetical protein C8R46DRAFT_1227469 [Mycena filopes]|nr:hypothetical protein C8R46DRAFT_1227469 [Mycena filopes]
MFFGAQAVPSGSIKRDGAHLELENRAQNPIPNVLDGADVDVDVDMDADDDSEDEANADDKADADDDPDADDEADAHEAASSLGKRSKKKRGPEPFTNEQRGVKRDENNAKRRRVRKFKQKTGLVITDEDQASMSAYLVKEFSSLLEQQQVVNRAIAGAKSNDTSVLVAVDAVRREVQRRAPSPIPILHPHLHEFLSDYSMDPLHLNIQPWLDRGVLVEDVGSPDIEPDNTARTYIRFAQITSEHVVNFIGGKMYGRPADIPWLAAVLFAHGTDKEDVVAAVKSALTHYGLSSVFSAVEDSIRNLAAISGPQLNRSLSLTNPGITIGATPFMRLQQELASNQSSRFHHMSKNLDWKAYHLVHADLDAPGGTLDFRTNPAIGKREAVAVNASRGLVLNTTPGGVWIPDFQLPIPISNLLSAAHLKFPSITAQGLSIPTSTKIETLLREEWKFWRKEVGSAKVCVKATLKSVKENLADAAWTVEGTTVMVTVAEDITEEERKGRVAGIDAETAGPALKEFMYLIRMLNPADASLTSPSDLKQIRGPFLDLYRLQEPLDRASHLAFLVRLLSCLSPVLVTTWSNTIAHAFRHNELRNLFRNSDPAELKLFLDGQSHDPSKVVPNNWYSDGVKTQRREYIDSLGLPYIAYTSHSPNSLAIVISTLHFGGIKHDPIPAPVEREISAVIQGGIAQPASIIIADDLRKNGPLDRSDLPGLEARLQRLRTDIYDHAECNGVYKILAELKEKYLDVRRSLALLRGLPHRNKMSSSIDDDGHLSASCPGEGDSDDEVEDEDDVAAAEEDAGADGDVGVKVVVMGFREKAATGAAAREAQLERLVEEALTAERFGLVVDPHGYAPFGTTLTSEEFAIRFRALADGTDLAQWGRCYGRTAAANAAAIEGRQKIGKWNAAQALERRTLREAETKEERYTREITEERAHRSVQLSRFLTAVQDPRKVKDQALSLAVRWGTCAKCGEIIVGSANTSKHWCPEDPANPIYMNEGNFPSQRRLVYSHDVFHTPELDSLLTKRPALVSRAVAVILTAPILQQALPLDHASYDPSLFTKSVFLPPALKDNKDLWILLAVDVLLGEQAKCADDVEPTTTPQRNLPWKTTMNKALCAWAKARLSGQTDGPELVLAKCDWGWMGALPETRFWVLKDCQERFYIHTCGFTGDWEQSECKRLGVDKVTPNARFDGPRNCRTLKFQDIGSLIDLPADYARYVWLHSRIFTRSPPPLPTVDALTT